MINQYAHPNADGTVGDIKCRPMGGPNIKIKEIQNLSISEPVYQISNGTTKNQGQAIGQEGKVSGTPFVKPQHKKGNQRRHEQENKFPDFKGLGCKKAKSATRIKDMRQVKKLFNNNDMIMQDYIQLDHILGDLVSENNAAADQNQSKPNVFQGFITCFFKKGSIQFTLSFLMLLHTVRRRLDNPHQCRCFQQTASIVHT